MPATAASAEEPEQSTLYSISPTDMLSRIDEKRKAWVRIKQQVVKNLEQRKELRRLEHRTYAEFLDATGGGVQETIDEAEENEALAAKAATGEVMTASKHAEKLRAKIIAGAVRVLGSSGGRLENTQLAAYLNVDSHGLSGYLKDAPEIRKEYSGRMGNDVLVWVLV